MSSGFQFKDLTYWGHGSMVVDYFDDLMTLVQQKTWQLPKWFTENAEWIRANLVKDLLLIRTYQQWHDCGKPYCREVDTSGKVHYPNHANISADIWLSLEGDKRVADLIARDMDCHLLRPADALEFSTTRDALILLITTLCELHANAEMFGGIQSDSFKIKWKRLNKCGNTIVQAMKGSHKQFIPKKNKLCK